MMEMTDRQKIETLATKVMGWEVIYNDWRGLMIKKQDGTVISAWSWNPLKNLADAFQVAEKFDSYTVKKIQYMHVYSCVLRSELLGEALAGGITAQEAICNAAYKLVA